MTNATLLIADRNAFFRQSMRRAAESRGFHVEEASDGEEALELFEKTVVDVLLVDVELPNLDGIDVSRLAHEADPDMPVVMRAARTLDPARMRLAIDAGVAECIERTCPFPVVLDRLEALMGGKEDCRDSGEWRVMASPDVQTQTLWRTAS